MAEPDLGICSDENRFLALGLLSTWNLEVLSETLWTVETHPLRDEESFAVHMSSCKYMYSGPAPMS